MHDPYERCSEHIEPKFIPLGHECARSYGPCINYACIRCSVDYVFYYVFIDAVCIIYVCITYCVFIFIRLLVIIMFKSLVIYYLSFIFYFFTCQCAVTSRALVTAHWQ